MLPSVKLWLVQERRLHAQRMEPANGSRALVVLSGPEGFADKLQTALGVLGGHGGTLLAPWGMARWHMGFGGPRVAPTGGQPCEACGGYMQRAQRLSSPLLLQVIVVEDENGNVVRETMKDTGEPLPPQPVVCLNTNAMRLPCLAQGGRVGRH